MDLETIRSHLKSGDIFHAENPIENYPSIAGYDKQFRWSWMATQLNSFYVAVDVEEEIETSKIEELLQTAFTYAEKHYSGWPRGFQSGIGVVLIVLANSPNAAVQEYCLKLKSGKKWAGFTIPVVIDKDSKKFYYFDHKPIWGMIYYPYFEGMIKKLCSE